MFLNQNQNQNKQQQQQQQQPNSKPIDIINNPDKWKMQNKTSHRNIMDYVLDLYTYLFIIEMI